MFLYQNILTTIQGNSNINVYVCFYYLSTGLIEILQEKTKSHLWSRHVQLTIRSCLFCTVSVGTLTFLIVLYSLDTPWWACTFWALMCLWVGTYYASETPQNNFLRSTQKSQSFRWNLKIPTLILHVWHPPRTGGKIPRPINWTL